MQTAQTWRVIRPTTEVIHVLRIIGRLQKRRQAMQTAQTWRVIRPTTEVIHACLEDNWAFAEKESDAASTDMACCQAHH